MILILGLSPAVQRTLEFDELRLGGVNRATRVVETAGGKGVNTARVAAILGADVRLLSVAGGARGGSLERLLAKDGIDARVVRVKSETRVCHTIMGRGESTELVEEAGKLSQGEVAAVLRAFRKELKRATVVVLVGSLPKGCGDNFYGRLAREARQRKVPVLVDAQGKLLLNALREGPFLVRVNRRELHEATRGAGLQGLAGPAEAGAKWLVVSDGANHVQVSTSESGLRVWRFKPPRVQVVNTVGSGDAMLGGIAHALDRGQPMLEAIRWGLACGAANAMTATAGKVDRAEVMRLLRQMR